MKIALHAAVNMLVALALAGLALCLDQPIFVAINVALFTVNACILRAVK